MVVKKIANVALKEITHSDCEPLFLLQTIPRVREYCRNPLPPTWDEHKKWFEASLCSLKRDVFLITYEEKTVGVLRLDRTKQKNEKEVTIMVAPKYGGKGIGKQALKLIRSLRPLDQLIAEVHPDNVVSARLFLSSGYTRTVDNWYLNPPQTCANQILLKSNDLKNNICGGI